MDLVDDVDLVLELGGQVFDLVADLPYVVNYVVGSRVNLDDVDSRARSGAFAGLTFSAGISARRMLAVDRSGEDLCAGGLAGSPRAAEKIGVGGLAVFDLIAEYGGYMILAADV